MSFSKVKVFVEVLVLVEVETLRSGGLEFGGISW